MTESVARLIWQEFSPREDEELAFHKDFRDRVLITVTVGGSTEGFDIDPDCPFGALASALADRIQAIIMEARQQMVPGCPFHPAAHPLESNVADGAAAWVCPSNKRLVRHMRVTTEAT
jgi:hypothetical protein